MPEPDIHPATYNAPMTKTRTDAGPLQQMLSAAVSGLRNSGTRMRNNLARLLPGKRPGWVVLNLRGSYPARKEKRRLWSADTLMGKKAELSQEELDALVSAMLKADWLKGVVVRLEEPGFGLAAAYAIRRQLARLKESGRRVVFTANHLGLATYYLASVADEVIMPESAELTVAGLAISNTYRADFLGRFGLRVQKLAIREYKSSMDDLARSSMSDGNREQLNAILDSFQQTFARDVAASRGVQPLDVSRWIDEGVSSAAQARALGMIDRVAYEDEFLTKKHKPLPAARRFLMRPLRPVSQGRVAFVSLDGAIIPGKSRQFPVPLPLIGGKMAGSETLVRALRAAGRNRATRAVVFHVESGGGSALASDLIWREVKLLADRMPVVAVMGAVAGSGGYYVLTHATKVLASPVTITGSIGVLTMKFVMDEFNSRYGFNHEVIKRGRFADLSDSSRPWDDAEEAQVGRYIDEIYGRFVTRVAEGRKLDPVRVNEIGRGRIWSGEDALEIGLIDEIGDVSSAIGLARQLAGLHENAPVWTVETPQQYVLPVGTDADAVQRAVMPLLRERALLVTPHGGLQQITRI